MRSLVTSMFLLVISATVALSQPTITYDQFVQAFNTTVGMQSGDSYTATDVSGLSTLIAMSGANQTWDISSRTYTKQSDTATYSLVPASSAPLSSDPAFTGATHVLKIIPTDQTLPIVYAFYKIDQSGYYIMGFVEDSSGQYNALKYSPPMQQLKFPLTYNTTWTSTSNISVPGLPPGATYTMQVDATVDGYGTLKIPGTTAECLRIKRTTTTTIGFGGFNQTTITDDYEFSTSTGQSASISTDQNHQPVSLTYSVRGGSDDVKAVSDEHPSVMITANPAVSQTSVQISMAKDAPATLSILDITGHEIAVPFSGFAHRGVTTIDLNTEHLANGIYMLRLQSSAGVSAAKLIVSH